MKAKPFSILNRAEQIKTLTSEKFDLLIIGGGVTGAGIALDAASRGLKTCLIEKNDFASGTSNKSTKLIKKYLIFFSLAILNKFFGIN